MALTYTAGSIVRTCCAFSVGLLPANQEAAFALGETVKYDGVLEDPSTIVLKVTDGSGVQTIYSATTREATGLYHQDISVKMTTPGPTEVWQYEWQGTGTLVAPGDGFFFVQRSNQG